MFKNRSKIIPKIFLKAFHLLKQVLSDASVLKPGSLRRAHRCEELKRPERAEAEPRRKKISGQSDFFPIYGGSFCSRLRWSNKNEIADIGQT